MKVTNYQNQKQTVFNIIILGLLSFILSFATLEVLAQPAPLSGIYTIDNTLPTGGSNFISFNDASIALDTNGISAAVVFNVGAGQTFNEQVNFTQVMGATASNTITFNGNQAALVFSGGTSMAPYTLRLSGSDYFTFDGFFFNGWGTTHAYAAYLWDGANNNTFSNCTFNVPVNTSLNTHIPFVMSADSINPISGSNSGAACDSNEISFCELNNGNSNVYFTGKIGDYATNNLINNSDLNDAHEFGVFASRSDKLEISQNEISKPNRTMLANFDGIHLSRVDNGLIEKNHIHSPFAAVATATNSFKGIRLALGSASIIQNNVIENIKSLGSQTGIEVDANGIKIFHNTIVLDDIQASNFLTVGIENLTASTNIQSNNISITRSGSGNKYGLSYAFKKPAISDYNNIYVTGTNAYVGLDNASANQATLSSWQVATGLDANSIAVDPMFNNPAIIDYFPLNVLLAAGANTATTGVTEDINGTVRNMATPTIGAFEACMPAQSTDTIVACDSLTWTNGITYTSNNNTATDTFTVNGCDSIVTLFLTINFSSTGNDFQTICAGDSLLWNGNYYSVSGMYNDTVPATNMCDSVVTLTLMVNPNATGTDAQTICANDSILWNGRYYSAAGTYMDTVPATNTCDSVVTLTLTTTPNATGTDAQTICSNDSILWNGTYYSTAGTYVVNILTANACDSTVTLTLATTPLATSMHQRTICPGETLRWNGINYTMAGTYSDTIPTATGCDSVVTLTLTINSNSTGSDTLTICAGDTLLWNGKSYSTAGMFNDTLPAANTCDSIVTLILTVNPNTTGSETQSICAGDSLLWNGNYYSISGMYNDTLVATNTCDSVITLTLSVNAYITGTDTLSICAGDSLLWNGAYYSTTGNYNDTIQSAITCDSIVTLVLSVMPLITGSDAQTICAGDSILWNGRYYSLSGIYNDTLPAANACDSIATLTLTINSNAIGLDSITICAVETLSWNGKDFSVAGMYTDTLPAANTCDSVVSLILTVNPNTTGTDIQSICVNDSLFWNSKYYSIAGSYNDTLPAANTCDSVITLTLTVLPTATSADVQSICAGDSLLWNGTYYTATGMYNDTFTAANTCDSVVTLSLTVNTLITGADAQSICENDSLLWNGAYYSTTGMYNDTLIAANGCDSIVTLNLTVNPHSTGADFQNICVGDSLLWNGAYYNANGIYTDTLPAANTCDSVVTLTLSLVNPNATIIDDQTICEGDSILWNGAYYSIAGNYNTTLACNSVVVLSLTVNPILFGADAQSICAGDSLLWNGNYYNSAGSYNVTLPAANTCDSIVTLTLTVNQHTLGSDAQTICTNDSILWNGSYFNTAGNHIVTLTAANGCDSIVTLNLTLNPISLTTDAQTICAGDSLLWNGVYYSNAGSYNITFTGVNTCDSVVILSLTIVNTSGTITDVQTICAGDSILRNGIYFNATGIYNLVLPCDGIVRLDLTVSPPVTSTNFDTICSGDSILWNGAYYSTTGIYRDTLSSANACDSITTLNLTVNPIATSIDIQTICSGQPLFWNGALYGVAGNYNVTLTAANGCDSIATLVLSVVNPNTQVTDNETICNGDSILWNGTYYKEAGSYSLTLNCNAIVSLNLTVDSTATGAESLTICNGDSILWNGNYYSASGTYYVTLSAANSCDSIVELTLAVLPTYNAFDAQVICEGDSLLWNGVYYNSRGVYQTTLVAANGCDSSVTLSLIVNPSNTGTEAKTICSGDSILWNGNYYSATGIYDDTLPNINGCDSLVTLNLTVRQVITGSEAISICAFDSVRWNGTYYSTAGTYSETFSAANSCDSVVTLTLTVVNANSTITNNQTICAGDSLLWNGNYYTAAGQYIYNLNCNSQVTLNLAVNPIITSTSNQTICAGDSILWHGNYYSVGGSYIATLPASNTCDSLVTLVLTVNPIVTGNSNHIICEGELLLWNGAYYNSTGVYQTTLKATNSCDSVVTLNLIVKPNSYGSDVQIICSGDSLLWHGTYYNTSGIYNTALVAANGCDSVVTLTLEVANPNIVIIVARTICIGDSVLVNGNHYKNEGSYNIVIGCNNSVTLNLNVNQNASGEDSINICPGDSILWNGSYYSTAGMYDVTLSGSNGCDSVVTLTLTNSPVITGSDAIAICAGDSILWHGAYYSTVGSYNHTLSATSGCDSVVTLTLTIVNPNSTITQNQTLCAGDSILWNGSYYQASGLYLYTLNCNSQVQLNLTVNPIITSSINQTICEGDSILWQGVYYLSAGSYSYTFSAANGCDSIATLNLTVNIASTGSEIRTICASDSLLWNGTYYNTTGIYTDTLPAANNCDSVVTLSLTMVNPNTAVIDSQVICTGDSLLWNGIYYSDSGQYTVALPCNSTATLSLMVNPTTTGKDSLTICAGDSILWNGNYYSTAGNYDITLAASNTCDSVVSLFLIVNPNSSGSETQSICAGDSLLWNGKYFSTAGYHSVVLPATNTCDSIVTLTLIVDQQTSGIDNQTICSGDSLLWNGNYYTTMGMFNHTLPNARGCDSVVTLMLSINPILSQLYNEFLCAGDTLTFRGSNSWGGQILTGTGTFVQSVSGGVACDTVVTVNLFPLAPIVTNQVLETCAGDSVLWNGNYYKTTGNYNVTFSAANGCDSTATLSLRINQNYSSTSAQSICDGDSILWNNAYYNSTGVYQVNLPTIDGCDSSIVLSLTVNANSAGADIQTLCFGDSLLWNGDYYFTSGTYQTVLTAANGCDSVVTLSLTVNPAKIGADVQAICAGDSLLWNGTYYNAAGIYLVTLPAFNSCDSLVTLTLTVNQPTSSSNAQTICSGDSLLWNGIYYNAPGVYQTTLPAANTCDSIVSLTLNVNGQVLFGVVDTTFCDTLGGITLNGQLITVTGSTNIALPNMASNGCDSSVIINATVLSCLAIINDTVRVSVMISDTTSSICPTGDDLLLGIDSFTIIDCGLGIPYGNWIMDSNGCLIYMAGNIAGNNVDTFCGYAFNQATGQMDLTIIILSVKLSACPNFSAPNGIPNFTLCGTGTTMLTPIGGGDSITGVTGYNFYGNAALTNMLANNVNQLNTSTLPGITDSIYITAINNSCESAATLVLVEAKVQPVLAALRDTLLCRNAVSLPLQLLNPPVTIGTGTGNYIWYNDAGSMPDLTGGPIVGQTALQAGTYWVIYNENGCSAQTSLNIDTIICATVDLELTAFEAKAENCEVTLNWATATESNIDFFIIERCSDGFNYDLIGRANAVGNSTTMQNYNWVDENPTVGTSYYRLVEIQEDRTENVLQVISVNSNCLATVSDLIVYPNPAINNLNIVYSSDVIGTSIIEIIDELGRVVLTDEKPLIIGDNNHTIAVGALPNAVYVIRLLENNNRLIGAQKFIKVED